MSGTSVLANKHVGFLHVKSDSTRYNVGKVDAYGIKGHFQNVIISNYNIYDTSCVLYGSAVAFTGVLFASSGRGISVGQGSLASLYNCSIAGAGSSDKPADWAIIVAGGFLTSSNTTGIATQGIYVTNGSLASLNGTCPGPGIYAPYGTVIGNYTVDGAVVEKPPTIQTATFTPSTWCTWECISGSLWKRITVDVSVQSRSWSGLNNTNLYPNRFCKRAGWWVLDTGTSIKDTLSGKTISKATVIINRTNTGEAYKLTLAYHGVTNCNLNGYSVSADYNIANQLISIGVYDISADSGQVIIDLPSSLYSKLQDGTIKGFGLLNNGTYFKDVYCDGTCTLNVTYT